MKFEDHNLGVAENSSQLFISAPIMGVFRLLGSFSVHGGLFNGSLGVGAPSGWRQLRRVLFQSNGPDPWQDKGLVKIVDL